MDLIGGCPAPCSPAGFGIRLNKQPPEIVFRKKDKGGINYTSAVPNPKLDLDGRRWRLDGLGWAWGGVGRRCGAFTGRRSPWR